MSPAPPLAVQTAEARPHPGPWGDLATRSTAQGFYQGASQGPSGMEKVRLKCVVLKQRGSAFLSLTF